ncbi:MAG: hypothetical protein MUC71_04065 [Steroidobacteraceae bacterium]|jgi:hypothetical protein|nr:hypothetical protein [Steroidobacteraceae bacterium]
MRIAEVVRQGTLAVLCCIVTAAVVAGPPIPRSLFYRQFIEQPDGTLAGPSQIWAEGNNTHCLMLHEGRFVHALQRGDSLYIWIDGHRDGQRKYLGNGLASYGVIRQIERIRNLGAWDREVKVDGAVYEFYMYTGIAQIDGQQYEEHVSVSFDSRSGAPKVWVSDIMVGGSGVFERLTMIFRDVEVNKAMPLGIFDLPNGVVFTEKK